MELRIRDYLEKNVVNLEIVHTNISDIKLGEVT